MPVPCPVVWFLGEVFVEASRVFQVCVLQCCTWLNQCVLVNNWVVLGWEKSPCDSSVPKNETPKPSLLGWAFNYDWRMVWKTRVVVPCVRKLI